MHAVVTAGGAPRPKDPLYPETQGGYKALLEIAGRSMIQWVLDALSGSSEIEQVIVVGLPLMTDLTCTKPLIVLPDEGSMLDNLKAGVDALLKIYPQTEQFLAVSSDIPAITAEMVDWTVRSILETDHDIIYNVIERPIMEKRFPTSNRTYLRLKDVEVCGGDLIGVRASIVNPQNPLFQKMVEARKSPVKQASLLGYDTLLLILLHRLELKQAADLISKRLGVTGRAIFCPYPEIGMDVDKPHQLQAVRADLLRQIIV